MISFLRIYWTRKHLFARQHSNVLRDENHRFGGKIIWKIFSEIEVINIQEKYNRSRNFFFSFQVKFNQKNIYIFLDSVLQKDITSLYKNLTIVARIMANKTGRSCKIYISSVFSSFSGWKPVKKTPLHSESSWYLCANDGHDFWCDISATP